MSETIHLATWVSVGTNHSQTRPVYYKKKTPRTDLETCLCLIHHRRMVCEWPVPQTSDRIRDGMDTMISTTWTRQPQRSDCFISLYQLTFIVHHLVRTWGDGSAYKHEVPSSYPQAVKAKAGCVWSRTLVNKGWRRGQDDFWGSSNSSRFSVRLCLGGQGGETYSEVPESHSPSPTRCPLTLVHVPSSPRHLTQFLLLNLPGY